MGQISMNAYDADVFIPEFRGLMQAGDQMGGDLRYSPDCMNNSLVGSKRNRQIPYAKSYVACINGFTHFLPPSKTD